MQKYIKKLLFKESLTFEESYNVAVELLTSATPAQSASVMSLLASKGETRDEVLGFIKALKEKSLSIPVSLPVLDIVGTGGDYSNTYNISTASSLLVAACGVPVIKHGNRAVSSNCGAADVLEELGYNINMDALQIVDVLTKDNFAFCFAPNFHPVLAHLRSIRKEIGIPTIFNLLGPLLNPANPEYMVIGVNSKAKTELFASIIQKLKVKRAMIVHGNGLDEISCLGITEAILIDNGQLSSMSINPADYGLKICTLDQLKGGVARDNAKMLVETLSGTNTGLTDTVVLNAAVALYVYRKVESIQGGVMLAQQRIAQGNIIKQNKLQQIIDRKRAKLLNAKYKTKSFKAALMSNPNGAIICELKRASPSLGQITTIEDPIKRAREYVKAGANAISVLTDEGFSGSIDDLTIVADSLADTNIPVLCKDFIFTPEQIAAAAKAGASAILLMVSVLKDKTSHMVKLAHEFGLETLVEIHSESELPIALSSGTDVIGVNQRDLTDFSMHPELFEKLIMQLPNDMVKVAESGIKSFHDASKLYDLGYNAVLVGEAFSRLENPANFFIDGELNAN